jgi:hypothetical protein
VELKQTYFNQAKKNIEYLMSCDNGNPDKQGQLFSIEQPLEAPEIDDDEDLDAPIMDDVQSAE